MAYCTAAEVRAQIDKDSNADDATITAMIAAAEEAINNFCNRPDGFEAGVAAARTFGGSGKAWQWIDETESITTVEVKDSPTDTGYTTWAADDWVAFSGSAKHPNYNLTPYQALMVTASGDYATFTSGKFSGRRGFRPDREQPFVVETVRVTARWGYSVTVPDAIKQACITQTAIWYKRGQGGWSKILASNEFGALEFDEELDPAVRLLLWSGRFIKPATGNR